MSSALKNKKVLVIEDEQSMLDIIKSVLKREGAFALGAVSLDRAGTEISRDNFDVIILDRYLPDGDGHDFLKTIKDTDETSSIPVIMLTGEKNIAEIQESVRLGAAGYVLKPFKPKDFLLQIDKVLSNKAYI